MSQAMDDLEEEQDGKLLSRIKTIERIIESHYVETSDYHILPKERIEGIAYEIERLYEQALEEADTLSREQIIKIIRGTIPTDEQQEMQIIEYASDFILTNKWY